ncbi:hypothetical protein BHYA_0128g00240 [Botrytis hyacinthi]|uniref:Uncharacterized protein n=1 Tax=Botrytis hyacinthi TaxID=278943 RepID=A0A4Z1GRX3_9HELO|nr:hypothetical protein BHYA_0128g00240 [Botrytis hyacinthi]
MTSQVPTNAGASMPASEIQALAMSGQENFVPAAEEASQDSHSFLYLAPKTSAGYPVAQSAKVFAALTPRQLGDQTRGTIGGEELGEKVVSDEDGRAKNLGSIEQELGKAARSESMSSEASNSTVSSVDGPKGMSSRRFLKLGPVHFGEAGLGDWSEEVVE